MPTLTRTRTLIASLVVAAAAASAALIGCPGSQVKGSTGEVSAVLRRIDVVEADFDEMKLHVVVAIENGTGSDVSASAEASIAVVGEAAEEAEEAPAAPAEGEGEGEGEDSSSSSGSGGEVSAEEEAKAASAAPVDGQRHKGSGAGKAAAYNTSELPIEITLPLPSDPALLEQMLGWKKMLVHVEGNVKVGGDTRRLGGSREVAPPHIPAIRLKEAQVASVDGGTAGTGFFTLIVDNKNPFAITIDKLVWSITIKGKELKPQTGGTEVEKDGVPASSVSEYQAEVQINEAAFGKELKALLKSPTVPYVIEGELSVRGIKKSFKFNGDMKFAR